MHSLKRFRSLLVILVVFLTCFWQSLGFSCYQCDTDQNDAYIECVNETEKHVKTCPKRFDVCVLELVDHHSSGYFKLMRKCDGRVHVSLKDGCFSDLDVFNDTVKKCVCSVSNCNGLSVEEIRAQPNTSIEQLRIAGTRIKFEVQTIFLLVIVQFMWYKCY